MTEFNKTLTACLACNTGVSFLGDAGQAKSATFYMLKYMCKNPTSAVSTLPCILEAMSKKDNESTAVDSGVQNID